MRSSRQEKVIFMSKKTYDFDHESFAKEFKDLTTKYNLKIKTANLMSITNTHKLAFSSDIYVLSAKKKSYHEY